MNNSELLSRAVEQVVPLDLAEKKLAFGQPMRLYLGIDPTGARLHLGHSVPLRKLKAFADAGHEVIFLVGSFTAMIGDPSGRDQMREPLTPDQVKANFETYKEQASKVLDFSKVQIRYNHEWLEKLQFADIVKLSSHFTVQQMLKRDMFRKRMGEEKEITITEFLYPLMVGYDSVVLDVDCELGGSDQLFNMLAGRTLQTAHGKRDKFVLTTKLIEGTDGRKMSKTYDNCVWITDEPKEMYGKIMRIEDRLITTYMECCTDIPMEEIKETETKMKNGENPMDFKKKLAHEVVRLYHDDAAADGAEEEFRSIFSEGNVPTDMPEIVATKGESLLELLLRTKLIPSKSEGRRLIEQGGIQLNNKVVQSVDAQPEEGTVKVGKRKFASIVLS